jgi:hypothetical protein
MLAYHIGLYVVVDRRIRIEIENFRDEFDPPLCRDGGELTSSGSRSSRLRPQDVRGVAPLVLEQLVRVEHTCAACAVAHHDALVAASTVRGDRVGNAVPHRTRRQRGTAVIVHRDMRPA